MSKPNVPPPSKSGFAQDGYQPDFKKGYQPPAPTAPVSVKPPSGGSNVTPPPPKKE